MNSQEAERQESDFDTAVLALYTVSKFVEIAERNAKAVGVKLDLSAIMPEIEKALQSLEELPFSPSARERYQSYPEVKRTLE